MIIQVAWADPQFSRNVVGCDRTLATLIKQLQTQYPNIAIDRQDERLTSIIARQTIQQSVHKKSQRQDKNLVDKISATIILQHYLKFNI